MKTIVASYSKIKQSIFIGHSILNKELLKQVVQDRNYVLIGTSNLLGLHSSRIQGLISSKCKGVVSCKDGEDYKNIRSFNFIITKLIEYKVHRQDLLIVVGGGMIGDLAGFAASCYMRGTPFISIPTTLLSAVDSSVGGKVAVNHSKGKNMIGAFFPAESVLISTDFFSTLPQTVFTEGLSEVIKYGVIGNLNLLGLLEDNSECIMARKPEIIEKIIYYSVKDKIEIVEIDEFEKKERKYLNFGHSFGHAIEVLGKYHDYSHGQAVAIGMLMAAGLSFGANASEVVRLESIIKRFELPYYYKIKSISQFIAAMKVDKKNNDNINLILLKKIGVPYIAKNFDVDALHKYLSCPCRFFGIEFDIE